MTTAFDVNSLYINVKTNTIVTVLDKGKNMASIATVNGDSTGRSRSVQASAFRKGYLAHDGQPHTSGYVPLTALPEDHPHAPEAPKSSRSNMIPTDNLDELNDDELALLILEQESIKKDAADIADRAKAVAKARRGGKLGLDVRGDIALVYTPGTKFDAGYAKRNLSAEDFKRILLPKPDATMARKLFENEPDKLAACLKDNGPSLTVRKATDEDFEKHASSRPKGEEDFSFTV